MRLWFLVPLLVGCGKKFDGDGKITADEVPDVGWTAKLQGHHHDVGGTAVIVDENTIEIRDFTYDGGGINSRFFLVADGDRFFNDFELTDNLVGDDYNGETLTVDIPNDAPPSSGEWNVLTLWCLPAKANFGDGQFQPPPD